MTFKAGTNGRFGGLRPKSATRSTTPPYPQKLIETPIEAGCSPGGVVLDPFLGSGTTALVARRLGRHYIGIEPNPEYVAIARSRLERESEPSKQ